jgi:hypothetical protein
MNQVFAFPKLFYNKSHSDERGMYKYADDLFNPNEWEDYVEKYSDFVSDFIQKRLITGASDPTLLITNISSRKRDLESFQTLLAEVINHDLFSSVGTLIVNQYEHYRLGRGSGQSTKLTTVDQIPKILTEMLINLDQMREMINSNIRVIVSPEKIEFHENYIQGKENSNKFLVSHNPNFLKFQVLSSMIGSDIANKSASFSTSEKYSLEFTASSLIGWQYTSPQERTLGCPGDLVAILMDIIYHMIAIPSFSGNQFEGDPKKNNPYFFGKIFQYYEAMISSDVISVLSEGNEDFGQIKNPFALGLKDYSMRLPYAYSLWSIYRSVRTPFYDRSKVKKSKTFSTNHFTVKYNGTTRKIVYNFTTTEKKGSQAGGHVGGEDTKSFKDEIIKNFKSATEVAGMQKISDFETAVTEEKNATLSDLSTKSLQRFYNKLERIDKETWSKIVESCVMALIGNLLIVSQLDWKAKILPQIEGQTSSEFLQKYIFYEEGKNPNAIVFNDAEIQKYSIEALTHHVQAENHIRNALGITLGGALGGTSLQGNSEITVQRFNQYLVYPGDASVMEAVSNYFELANTDMNLIDTQIKNGIQNLTRRFWKRDVRRWLEVIHQIFEFFQRGGILAGHNLSKIKFPHVESILRMMYNKQITMMKEYIQKSVALERRIKKGVPDQFIEKQIKMVQIFSSTAICYLKNQILIIYFILGKIENSSLFNIRGVPFKQNQFRASNQLMQATLKSWFKKSTGDLIFGIKDPDLIRSIQELSKDRCGKTLIGPGYEPQTVTEKHLGDEKMNQIVTDKRFWLLSMSYLKTLDPSTVANNPGILKKLFIPIFEKSGKKNRFWLFDLIPFVLEGKFTGFAGTKSAPNWYSAKDFAKSKIFTGKDQAYVVLCGESNHIKESDKWKAINIKWFKNLIDKANLFSQKQKAGKDRVLWMIRFSIYLLLDDREIYKKVTNSDEMGSAISNDVDEVKINLRGQTSSRLKFLLKNILRMTDSNKQQHFKDTGGFWVNLISQDMFSTDLENAKTIFNSLQT